METGWGLIIFIYITIAFALYGFCHWIEVVLGKKKKIVKKITEVKFNLSCTKFTSEIPPFISICITKNSF